MTSLVPDIAPHAQIGAMFLVVYNSFAKNLVQKKLDNKLSTGVYYMFWCVVSPSISSRCLYFDLPRQAQENTAQLVKHTQRYYTHTHTKTSNKKYMLSKV